MMRFAISILLILITNVFFGQDKLSEEKVQIGLPYPVVDAASKNYFTYKELIIGVKVDGRRFHLQTYNTNKLTHEKIKVYEDFPKGFQVEEFLELKDRIFLFYSLWDKPNQKEQLFVREIDPVKCTFIGKGKLVLAIKGKVTGSFSNRGFYNISVVDKFDCLSSFDESKLLIQYRKKPEARDDSKNKDIIGFSVFDENLNLLWQKDIKMPYTEKKMDNIDYTIDAEGNAYLLARVYRDNSTRLITKDKEINYDVELIKFAANTGAITQKKIELKTGKYISDLMLFESGDDKIVCAGYYSSGGKNGTDYSDVNGVFKFDLGKGGEDFKIDYYDIPIEIINQNLRSREIKKNKKKEGKKEKAALAELSPQTLYIADDGSIVLIGEQAFTVTTTYVDSRGNTRTRTTYYYNDILVTKINKDGSLAWMKKLAKRQSGGRGEGSMSFKLIEGDESIYLVYMDNIANLDLGTTEVPEYHKDGAGGFLTAFRVNYDSGDVRKISLLDSRNVKQMKMYQFKLSRISSNTNDEFVFEVYKKKKEDILIKVELK